MAFKIIFITIFLHSIICAELGYVDPWGIDKELIPNSAPQPSLKSKAGEGIILFYQKYITQISGPRSHFRPTSSQYMLEAIRKWGFFKGYAMGCDRLLRENGETWVYRTKKVGDALYKWDPP